jgi:hypothetical protein
MCIELNIWGCRACFDKLILPLLADKTHRDALKYVSAAPGNMNMF